MVRKLVVACLVVLSVPTVGFAESVAHGAGKAVGEFGAGVGEAVANGVSKGLASMQPQWITIAPRSKDECLAESGGVLNKMYMRCRDGRQEYVRYDANGNKIVLNERPIPMQ